MKDSARPWLVGGEQIVKAEVLPDDDDQMLDWRCRAGRLCARRTGERDKRRRREQQGSRRELLSQESRRARYCATKSQPTISL